MANKRKAGTSRVETWYDDADLVLLEAEAQRCGITRTEYLRRLLHDDLHGSRGSDVPEEIKLALVQLAQGQTALAQQLQAVRQDGLDTRTSLQNVLGGIADGTQKLLDAPAPEVSVSVPELPAPDMSGIEDSVKALVDKVDGLARVPEPKPKPQVKRYTDEGYRIWSPDEVYEVGDVIQLPNGSTVIVRKRPVTGAEAIRFARSKMGYRD